jgi:hypothetical protein
LPPASLASSLAKSVLLIVLKQIIRSVLPFVVIVPTSVRFAQGLMPGVLSTEVTYMHYVLKYAMLVLKNAPNTLLTTQVVKSALKPAKNALSYALSLLKHSITLMVKGRLLPLTIISYSCSYIFNVYLSAKFLI